LTLEQTPQKDGMGKHFFVAAPPLGQFYLLVLRKRLKFGCAKYENEEWWPHHVIPIDGQSQS